MKRRSNGVTLVWEGRSDHSGGDWKPEQENIQYVYYKEERNMN